MQYLWDISMHMIPSGILPNLIPEEATSQMRLGTVTTGCSIPPPPTSPSPASPSSYTNWKTETTLGSGHLPIIIACSTNIKPQIRENKTFINFKKADWTTFTKATDVEFLKLVEPEDVNKAENCFCQIIIKVSKRYIPQGRSKISSRSIPLRPWKK